MQAAKEGRRRLELDRRRHDADVTPCPLHSVPQLERPSWPRKALSMIGAAERERIKLPPVSRTPRAARSISQSHPAVPRARTSRHTWLV